MKSCSRPDTHRCHLCRPCRLGVEGKAWVWESLDFRVSQYSAGGSNDADGHPSVLCSHLHLVWLCLQALLSIALIPVSGRFRMQVRLVM